MIQPLPLSTNNSMRTYLGIVFYPYAPRAEAIQIEDIAHHLSLLCRFNGAVRTFYSVAEHSVRVAAWVHSVAPEHALWALLHDASEAYIGDMIRPVKHAAEMQPYREVERGIMACVLERYDLPLIEPAIVTQTDRRICMTESAQLKNRPADDLMEAREGYQPLPITIDPWTFGEAKARFLEAFASYGGQQC